MAKGEAAEILTIEAREVRITHPDKLYFSKETKLSKIDIVRYYLAVAPGALRGIQDRPIVLKRFVNGAEGEAFYQKRAPSDTPAWLRTVTLSFPSGRTAEEVVVDDASGLAWIVNLGAWSCIPIRCARAISTIPMNCALISIPVRRIVGGCPHGRSRSEGFPRRGGPARLAKDQRLARHAHQCAGCCQRGRSLKFAAPRLLSSRAIERRVPALASSKWWKEERHGVFLDYNQNAKDRTTCSAYSGAPAAGRSRIDAAALERSSRFGTVRFHSAHRSARVSPRSGDAHAEIDASAGSLDHSLELTEKDEREGLGDAPWPPHFRRWKARPLA